MIFATHLQEVTHLSYYTPCPRRKRDIHYLPTPYLSRLPHPTAPRSSCIWRSAPPPTFKLFPTPLVGQWS